MTDDQPLSAIRARLQQHRAAAAQLRHDLDVIEEQLRSLRIAPEEAEPTPEDRQRDYWSCFHQSMAARRTRIQGR